MPYVKPDCIMKRLLSSLAAALMVCLTVSVFASNPIVPDAEILFKTKKLDDNTLAVRLANLQQERTTVQLVDMTGREYFSEVVTKHNGFVKQLNLENLSDGLYKLVVRQGKDEYTRLVKKDNDTILYSQVHE